MSDLLVRAARANLARLGNPDAAEAIERSFRKDERERIMQRTEAVARALMRLDEPTDVWVELDPTTQDYYLRQAETALREAVMGE